MRVFDRRGYEEYGPRVPAADGYRQVNGDDAYYGSDMVEYYGNGHVTAGDESYVDYNGHYDYTADGYHRTGGSFRYNNYQQQRQSGRGQHYRGGTHGERSDSESEPMSYNSRPYSYVAGRSV